MIATDRARFLQRANATQAGWGGQADTFGQFDIGHPTIGLQQRQNLPIDAIERHYTILHIKNRIPMPIRG